MRSNKLMGLWAGVFLMPFLPMELEETPYFGHANGGFADEIYYPVSSLDEDYRFRFGFLARTDLWLSLSVSVTNEKIRNAEPLKRLVIHKPANSYLLLKGETKEFFPFVPKDRLDKSRLAVTVVWKMRRVEDAGWTDWANEFSLGYEEGVSWNITGSGSLGVAPGKGAMAKNGRIYDKPYRIDFFSAFERIVDPKGGRLSFGSLSFRETDYSGHVIPFSPQNADLLIWGKVEKFRFLPKIDIQGQQVVFLPMEMVKGEGYEVSFSLKEEWALNPSFSEMRQKEKKQVGDLLTQDLYFPLVKEGETDSWDCLMRLRGCGENDKWSIDWNFEVLVTRNHFGSCFNSDWCVREEVS